LIFSVNIRFDFITKYKEWRLKGRMMVEGKSSMVITSACYSNDQTWAFENIVGYVFLKKLIYIFMYFRLFWCAVLKNNFLKIEKKTSFWCISTLKIF